MPTHNRHAAGNDEDLVPLGPPPIRRFPSETPAFHDTKNSGISERIRPGFKLLQKHVATSAFHNSAQRLDPPRCHPDTRVVIQNQIYDWILMDLLIRQVWIMWMHGAAGAGKSAIMQSIAELCEKAKIPLASFFFFRTDPTRNSTASFIATLVYQLIQLIPQVQDEIFGIIENNPLIFAQSLKSQVENLIIQPLLLVRKHFKGFFVVLIDGLDECTERAHQIDLIQSLAAVSRSRKAPVVFLVASRREPQIEAAFARNETTSDAILSTNSVISRRLIFSSATSRSTGPGFICQADHRQVIRPIHLRIRRNQLPIIPRANPAHQLEVIHGIRLRDPSSQNPFAHLDALYQHIFSQIEALDKVLDIIAYALLPGGSRYIKSIQTVFVLAPSELDVLFADLTAVMLCEPPTDRGFPELKFLHASLPDFLVDQSRSEQYHIDLDEYRTKLLCRFLERRPPILDPLWSGKDLNTAIDWEQNRLLAINYLLGKAKSSARLHSAFMHFTCTFYSINFFDSGARAICPNILQHLKRLDFSDQGEAYRHVVDILAPEYAKYWPSFTFTGKQYVEKESPDLAARLPLSSKFWNLKQLN
ncbi:hypothetical protein BJ912DRAFT_1139998 [Pholiota molesta]|nr:hypothetical protein BJ912DRAFT_1139998 [Pholiota molesta]